nr:hypothetical protein [Nannocystis exedens]
MVAGQNRQLVVQVHDDELDPRLETAATDRSTATRRATTATSTTAAAEQQHLAAMTVAEWCAA